MKKCILIIFVFFLPFKILSQGKSVEYAFERVVFERWDKFRPFWWFKFIHRKYDDEDRRNILQLAPITVQTSITKDYTDNQKKSIDTLFQKKVLRALDRTVTKRWFLFDQKKVELISLKVMTALDKGASEGWSVEEQLIFSQRFLNYTDEITSALESYIPDQEKSDQIHFIIEKLEEFERFLRFYAKAQRITKFQEKRDEQRLN